MDHITLQLAKALQDIRQGVTKDGVNHNGYQTPEELVQHNGDRYDPRYNRLRLIELLRNGLYPHTLKKPKNGGNHDHY